MKRLLAALTILAFALPAAAWADTSSPDQVQVTVTVHRQGANAPASLTKDDIFVFQNNQRRPVVDWVPLADKPAGLDLALVVDDSLGQGVGNQIRDLKSFINSLPESHRVAVVYTTHSNANFLENFTTDHQVAANALRLPQGATNTGDSVYLALADLIKHWPAAPAAGPNRRAVLLVSNGVDLFNGVSDSVPGINPNLQQAINQAQRDGVTVYTIYASGADRLTGNANLVNNGQSSLTELASETGGQAYFQGTETPLDFGTFLRQLSNTLGEQYLLTFEVQPGKVAGYQPLRVSTEQPQVELTAPKHVYVPAK